MRAVLERDFLAEVTRPRAFGLRCLPAVAVAAALAVAAVLGTHTLTAFPDRFGSTLLAWGGSVLLAVLMVLTPAVVTGAILPERLRGTLPLVLVTPVGAGRFVLAKFLARAGCVLGLAAGALPPLALAMWFGGVRWSDLLHLALTALAVVAETAGWALLVSCHARRMATGLVLAFVLPCARWWLTAAAAGAVLGVPMLEAPFASVLDTTPATAVLAVVSPGAFRTLLDAFPAAPGLPSLLRANPALPCLAVSILWTGLALALAARRLSRDGGEGDPEWIRVQTRWAVRLLGAMPRFANPVAWKETRFLNASASPPLYYGVLGLLLCGELSLLFLPGPVSGQGHAALLALQIPFVAFVAMMNGAATMGHEKAQGTLDLLLASPLPAERILRGKLAGVAAGTVLLALVPAVHAVAAAFAGSIRPSTALVALFLLAVLLRGAAGHGLRLGILLPDTRTALHRATLLFGALVALPPVAGAALEGAGRNLWGAGGFALVALGKAATTLSPPFLGYAFLEAAEQVPGADPSVVWFTHPLQGAVAGAFCVLLLVHAVNEEEALPALLRHRLRWESADAPYRFDRVLDRLRARIGRSGRSRWDDHAALRRRIRERRRAREAGVRRNRRRFRAALDRRILDRPWWRRPPRLWRPREA